MLRLQLLAASMLFVASSFAQYNNSYAVTNIGDTVWLNEDSYIKFESHPQTIHTKNKDGKKQNISANNVSILYMDAGKAGFYAISGMRKLTVVPIATKKGTVCHHFVHELAKQDSCSIYISPYCQRCSGLSLYYRNGTGKAYNINNKNFKEVCSTYFKGNEKMEEFSKRKRYNAFKLLELFK